MKDWQTSLVTMPTLRVTQNCAPEEKIKAVSGERPDSRGIINIPGVRPALHHVFHLFPILTGSQA